MRRIHHIPLTLLALLLLGANPLRAQDAPRGAERTITVSATGTMSAEPDRAVLTAGVQSEAATAREALAANSAAMAKVIAALKAAGIDAKDMRTQTLVLSTKYGKTSFSSNAVTGYTANNALRITVRDLKRIGDLIDEAVKAGANQLQGLTFEVSQAETLRDDARKAAMTNARRRAELYAAAAGVTLGPVLSISESQRGGGPRPFGGMERASSVSVPIEAGSIDLGVEVHVTYMLK